MTDRKRNNFYAMMFFTSLSCIYYTLSSGLLLIDIISALKRGKELYLEFFLLSGELYFQGFSFILMIAFAIICLIISAVTVIFYRKDISAKTFKILTAQAFMPIVWGVLFILSNFADLKFYIIPRNILSLTGTALCLIIPAAYAAVALKNMKTEIEFE